jgi:hypothetical protein
MMNRWITLLFAVMLSVMLCLTVGCGGSGADVGTPVEGVGGAQATEEQLAVLAEVFGLSEEEIAALSPEEREMMLAEAGYDMSHKPDENAGAQNGAAAQSRPTLSDVDAGGKYVVTVGDTLLWNYFELHYENGVLQSMTVHFQKSDEEEPEIEVLSGDAARGYEFYWINFGASPSTLVAELQSKLSYTAVYIERAQ